MRFQFGIVGQFVVAATLAVQLPLFAIIASEFRIKAPGAKTFLQVQHIFRLYYLKRANQALITTAIFDVDRNKVMSER